MLTFRHLNARDLKLMAIFHVVSKVIHQWHKAVTPIVLRTSYSKLKYYRLLVYVVS